MNKIEKKRVKSLSPDKNNKLKTSRFFEDSFFLHQRIPPTIAGCSITFYSKFSKNKRRNFSLIPHTNY